MKKSKRIFTNRKIEERIKTGIPGFDELIQGGFPRNSNILLAGAPGTGKSIFGMQYLINGSEKYNEKGLLVTFEQKRDDVIQQANQFGWDISKLEKFGKLKIMDIDIERINDRTSNDLRIIIRKEGIKRIVIDSLSTLVVNAPMYAKLSDIPINRLIANKIIISQPVVGDFFVKKFIYEFLNDLKGLNCTSLLIGESAQNSEYLSRDTVSEFVCDGVIVITFEALGGEFSRSLMVRKMRATRNDEDIHPLEIGNKGIVVHKIVK
ncbi:AAA family ATPase [Candidatus Pacearchaeota archaeon]|nr:AAA family ATPase [Candidatus Pacearchaeota archaeon]